MGVSVAVCERMVRRLPGVEERDAGSWVSYKVGGKGFGFLWERTGTIGLKATHSEQAALVAERPDVFEVQFTTESFGWVVVYLDGIDADELAELIFEAWRLTAPEQLAEKIAGPAELCG
ncbi:MAG: MmcQ/YjbR family DNA-binding protein [Streptosporangiales bacterium]|nr:MmcQ/YjbR family DNA-binding protein [Streptosporangiales bacterium]